MQLLSNNFDINHLIDYQVVDIHLMNQVYHYESRITMFGLDEQAITHIRGRHGDLNQ
jgi:hypothetical protein